MSRIAKDSTIMNSPADKLALVGNRGRNAPVLIRLIESWIESGIGNEFPTGFHDIGLPPLARSLKVRGRDVCSRDGIMEHREKEGFRIGELKSSSKRKEKMLIG